MFVRMTVGDDPKGPNYVEVMSSFDSITAGVMLRWFEYY